MLRQIKEGTQNGLTTKTRVLPLTAFFLANFIRAYKPLTSWPSSLQLFLKETPTQVFSCEYCAVFKNTYFEKHLGTAASKSLIRRHFFLHITISSSWLKPIYRKNARFLRCARTWFPWFLRRLRTVVKHFWSHWQNRFHLFFRLDQGRLPIILNLLELLQWMWTSFGGFIMWFRMVLIIGDFYDCIDNTSGCHGLSLSGWIF